MESKEIKFDREKIKQLCDQISEKLDGLHFVECFIVVEMVLHSLAKESGIDEEGFDLIVEKFSKTYKNICKAKK